ncbi:Flp family type IVb pilin [Microlunatus ginsengisoli]|uniref:Flp family type IVb pilin n=1 Tax=Microlunatus ginsengisoli TaxID=363863 RepID=A0ABP7ASR7_9ACTN
MSNAIKQFISDDEGATAVEYGLMVGLIAAVIVGTVAALGTRLDTLFGEVNTAIGGTNP